MTKLYTEGLLQDGVVILEDGIPINIEDIINKLNSLSEIQSIVDNLSELNIYSYSFDEIFELNKEINKVRKLLLEI